MEVRKGRRPHGPLDLVRAGRKLLVQAGVAASTRVEVRVGDAVAFLQGAAEGICADFRSQLCHPARHLVAEDPAVLGQAQRRIAAPEVQIGAADVGMGDADQDTRRLDLRDWHLPNLERLARTEEDCGFRGGSHARPYAPRSLPSSKASWSERTASSAYLSSMTHETAISEVEIIWMLMFSLESVAKSRAATPEWLRIPTPTMETLAMRSSATTPAAPISLATPASADSARCRSARARVKEISVEPSRPMFWTIMSTTMFCRASPPKTWLAMPGRSGTRRMESLACPRSCVTPVTTTSSML